nr:unnamed protein product [Digitaria exilis]
MASGGASDKCSVPALGWWLIAVGAFRSAFTWSCFFGSASFCSATFSEIPMTGVHGRTVAVWTLLSCTLCFLCAFNLYNKAIYTATFLSFVYAISYLGVECLGHPWFGCCFSEIHMAMALVLVELPSSPDPGCGLYCLNAVVSISTVRFYA